jgi:hypothetical protein
MASCQMLVRHRLLGPPRHRLPRTYRRGPRRLAPGASSNRAAEQPALLNEAGHARRGLVRPVPGQPAIRELPVGRMRLLDGVKRRGRDLGRGRRVLVLGLRRRYAATGHAGGDRNICYCPAVPAAGLVDHARQLKTAGSPVRRSESGTDDGLACPGAARPRPGPWEPWTGLAAQATQALPGRARICLSGLRFTAAKTAAVSGVLSLIRSASEQAGDRRAGRAMTWHQPEDPGIRELAGRFPGWEVWRGASGLLYARRHGIGDEPVTGEDAADLADQIIRAETLRGE